MKTAGMSDEEFGAHNRHDLAVRAFFEPADSQFRALSQSAHVQSRAICRDAGRVSRSQSCALRALLALRRPIIHPAVGEIGRKRCALHTCSDWPLGIKCHRLTSPMAQLCATSGHNACRLESAGRLCARCGRSDYDLREELSSMAF